VLVSGFFLQIDEKLLSYSDLQAEADDLYAKHGFRTYVVPRYPIFYDLSDLGEAEYRKDVKKRISELNTDSKPYIVVDLNLEKDLDFSYSIFIHYKYLTISVLYKIKNYFR
jgi:hypothetical protein